MLCVDYHHPVVLAKELATLDLLSGGRFHLGLGVSGPAVSEGWHGTKFNPSLARTREYVEVVRLALSGHKVTRDYRTSWKFYGALA